MRHDAEVPCLVLVCLCYGHALAPGRCVPLEAKSCAQAPGYFSVVQRAMDFTSLSGKVSSGAYSDWNAFLADLELIFMNAMKYNTPDTIYHKHVRGTRLKPLMQIDCVFADWARLRSPNGNQLEGA